jgi:hypothetical protein
VYPPDFLATQWTRYPKKCQNIKDPPPWISNPCASWLLSKVQHLTNINIKILALKMKRFLTCFVRIFIHSLPAEPAEHKNCIQNVVDGEQHDTLVRHVDEPLCAHARVDHVGSDAAHEDNRDRQPVEGVQDADAAGRAPLQYKKKL